MKKNKLKLMSSQLKYKNLNIKTPLGKITILGV